MRPGLSLVVGSVRARKHSRWLLRFFHLQISRALKNSPLSPVWCVVVFFKFHWDLTYWGRRERKGLVSGVFQELDIAKSCCWRLRTHNYTQEEDTSASNATNPRPSPSSPSCITFILLACFAQDWEMSIISFFVLNFYYSLLVSELGSYDTLGSSSAAPFITESSLFFFCCFFRFRSLAKMVHC